jgi:hypothetical protein
MLYESCLQVLGLRGLSHFGKSREDFLFGEIDIFQRVVEKVGKQLGFFSHLIIPED